MRSGKPLTAGLMFPGRPAAYTSRASSGGGIPGRRSADCATAASVRSSVRSAFVITTVMIRRTVTAANARRAAEVSAVLVPFRCGPARRVGDDAAQKRAKLTLDGFGDAVGRRPERRDVVAERALHAEIPVAAFVGSRHAHVPRADEMA